MDRRKFLGLVPGALLGGIAFHHRPWHTKGPPSTTTSTTSTTSSTSTSSTAPTTTQPPPTTTTLPPLTTTTTLRPIGDPIYADRDVTINPGDDWQDKIDGMI